jgi:hypothetical protein
LAFSISKWINKHRVRIRALCLKCVIELPVVISRANLVSILLCPIQVLVRWYCEQILA